MRSRTRGGRAWATGAALAVVGLALVIAAVPSGALLVSPASTPTAPEVPGPATPLPSGADTDTDTDTDTDAGSAEVGAVEAGSPTEALPSLAAPAPQVHYLPFRADHLWDVLDSQLGGGQLPEEAVRLVASLAAPRADTVVAVDHWEDGYDADPLGAPGPTTEVTTLGAGGVLDLSDTVDRALIGSLDPVGAGRPYHDGGDKIVSSRHVSVTAGGWPAITGAVHGGSARVADVAHSGTSFLLPVGEDAPFPAATPGDSPFEYTGAVVVATEADTSVTVAGQPAVTLDEGEAHLVDGGLHLGDPITASRPVSVFVTLGDVGHQYEGRLLDLAPTAAWADRYVTPVTSTNNSSEVARAFFYNPGGSALAVTVERSNATTSTVSVPAHGQGSFVLTSDVGARFSASGQPFTGMLVITSPEVGNDTSASYNWGVPLVPEDDLATSVIVPYGPGSANGTANYNPVWFATAAATTVYVDLDGDPTTGGSVAPGGRRYDFSCAAAALVPRVVKDAGAPVCSTPSTSTGAKGTGDADMTGAQLFTVDGTRLVAAWGQVPGLQAQNPALDLGAVLTPVPEPTPALGLEAEVYAGHDGGATCGLGGPSLTTVVDALVTWCFQVVNAGDTRLADVTLDDPVLGVTEADLTALSGTLDGLDQGETTTLYFESRVTGAVVSGTTAEAVPVDQLGEPLPGLDPVQAQASASLSVVGPALSLLTEALDPFSGSFLDADDVVGSPGTNDGVPVVLAAGRTTTARFTLANAGDVDITQVEVEGSGCDAPPVLVAGDAGVAGVLEVGEGWELTCAVSVGAQGLVVDGVGRGVTPFGPVPGSEVHETAALQVAAVGVQVQVRDPRSGDYVDAAVVPPREAATFRIVVTNTGEAALGQVTVHSATVPACDRVLPDVLLSGATSPPIECVSPPLDADVVNEVGVTATPVRADGSPVAEAVRAAGAAMASVDTTTSSTTTSTTTSSTTTTTTTTAPGPTTTRPAPPAVGADGVDAGEGSGRGLLERLPSTGAGGVAVLLGAAGLAIAAGLALQRRTR